MCTITFIARQPGYCLGMNRDEQRTRCAGLPPKPRTVKGRAVLCPSEPGGGTWIAVNDHGATFALINWNSITARVGGQAVSRGEVVNSVNAIASPALAENALFRLPLPQINPFRLIGVFPATGKIAEWRWDLQRLVRINHPWKTCQWISSGFDEPTAQKVRRRTFRCAQTQKSAGTIAWLRRLHGSHLPQSGPFSTCMHRRDAATVSYTEIIVSRGGARMRHACGSLCNCSVTSDHLVHF